ncbi:homoserine dehydrogenase [Enterococcus sp. LJL98]
MKKERKIGLLGLGVVATGVVELLAKQSEKIAEQTGVTFKLAKVLVLDKTGKEAIARTHGFELVTSLEEITEDPTIDVVIELIGRISPAKEYILAALNQKKHVITANKDLIAQHGPQLIQTAAKNQVGFYYEASVAGGIPILRSLSTSYLADEITSIQGIVNGTTNYMLTQMVENKLEYTEALAQAQALGFAESDPTNDVDGIDAAYKMIILGAFAFGVELSLNDLTIEGIRGLALTDIASAQSLGYEVKLIGEVKKINGGLTASVGPILVPQSHPLAMIKNENNGIYIESEGIGQSLFYGPGAGAFPTATSILSDLFTLGHLIQETTSVTPFNPLKKSMAKIAPTVVEKHYYLSVTFPTNREKTLLSSKINRFVSFEVEEEARLLLLTKALTDETLQELLDLINQEATVQGVIRMIGEYNEN